MKAILQFHELNDVAFNYEQYLPYTLNAKHSEMTFNSSGVLVARAGGSTIECQQATDPQVFPTLKYVGFGIRGYANLNDDIRCQPYRPSATNMDGYWPIPARVVPVAQDLNSTERADYRLRTRETINGSDYYCYWLKRLTYPDSAVNVTLITPSGTETPYTLDENNLCPTPVQLDIDDVDDDNDRIITSLNFQAEITGAEIVEAINIIFGGDLRYAKISEFLFCTGVDKTVTGDNNGSSFTYTEGVFIHLATHKCTLGTDLSNPESTYTIRGKYESNSIVIE